MNDTDSLHEHLGNDFRTKLAPQPVAAPLTHEEEKRVTADFYDAQAKRNPVPAPAVSAEAKRRKEQAEAWKAAWTTRDGVICALRAELTLLHESHDALAKGVETLRAEKKELRYLAEKCFKYLGAQIRKRLLNETAYDGTQSLSKEIADRLDRLDRAAMTAQKGRDAS